MRNAIKALAAACGFEVARKRRVRAPYLTRILAPGADYPFWIANDTGALWYGAPDHRHNVEMSALRALVGPGARVLEIGCHHGFHNVYLAILAGPGGVVVGVEAEPGNALIAQAQLALNRLAHCRIEPAAAGAVAGRAAISLVDNVIDGAGTAAERVEVPMVTADGIDQRDGPFTVLKIDVEGFEAKVLRGAAALLARRPRLALELHSQLLRQAGDRVDDVVALLAPGDYVGSVLLPTGESVAYAPERLAGLGAAHAKVNLFLTPR